jgi:hypothetical protein
MTEENGISESDAKELVRQMESENKTIPAFFKDVVMNEDTTKTGNLNAEELGVSNLPFRSYKELELFCRDICEDDTWADFFKGMGEIQTASSLSKDALLLKLVVTKKSEVSDMTPKQRKANKGWFKKDKEDTT